MFAAFSARLTRFARLTFTARRAFAAFLALSTFWTIAAFAALCANFADILMRLTSLARFTRFMRLTAFLLLSAAFTAIGAETVATAAIVAATAEISIPTTIATAIIAIELLLLALPLREVCVGLVAAALACMRFTLAALFIAFVIVFEAIVVHLLHRHGGLHLAHEPEIVIGVLHVIFAEHAVARRRRVARELQIALQDQRCVSAHLAALGTVAFHRPIGMEISTTTAAAVVMTAAGFTTAASLTLHQKCTIMLWSVVIAVGAWLYEPAPARSFVSLFA